MKFDKHIFISYSHIDNEPIAPVSDGWVTRFHQSLDAMLSMRLGRRATIWRDVKLAGNDVFADEIGAQFASTAVLLAVVSPRYVDSDWCRREAREFCISAEASCGLVVGNKARVFKIIKTPVDSQEPLPQVMRETLGVDFYVLDERQVPLELDSAFGADMLPKYNVKIAGLAWEIAQLVKQLEAANDAQGADANSAAPHADPAKPAVYLAECSYDRRDDRDALRAELRLRGYPVLPERELPRDETAYIAEVRTLLGRSALAVHLVGNQFGSVPDGPSQKSVVVLQNEIAAQCSSQRQLPRILWLPAATAPTDPQQQQFVAALLRDAQAQLGADLITADIGVLKSTIQAALDRIEQCRVKAESALAEAPAGRFVYLICDQRDRRATIALRKALRARGIEVVIPLFEGDAATLRRTHEEQLAQCDAVIVHYGAGDEAWKRTVDSDLRKARAHRTTPLPAPWIYLAPPASDDKAELVELQEAGVIDATAGFDEGALAPMVDALQSKPPPE